MTRRLELDRTCLHRLVLNSLQPSDVQAQVQQLDDGLQDDVHRIVHARNRQQEAEEHHEVHLPVRNEQRTCQHRGANAEPQKRLGRRRAHASSQLRPDLRMLEGVYPLSHAPEKRRDLVRGADLASAFQVLLDAIGKLEVRLVAGASCRLLKTRGGQQHRHCHRDRPQRRQRQTPVECEQANGHHRRRNGCTEQLRHDMGEHALVVGAVLHDRAREIRQIALPEERQR